MKKTYIKPAFEVESIAELCGPELGLIDQSKGARPEDTFSKKNGFFFLDEEEDEEDLGFPRAKNPGAIE